MRSATIVCDQGFFVRFEAAMALARSSDPKMAEISEDILQKICAEDPIVRAAVLEYRRVIGQ